MISNNSLRENDAIRAFVLFISTACRLEFENAGATAAGPAGLIWSLAAFSSSSSQLYFSRAALLAEFRVEIIRTDGPDKDED